MAERPPLSPVAQAVLDASIDAAFSPDAEAIAAAVLRAAADQVDFDPWLQEHVDYRDKLLAIAAELKGRHG